MVGTSNQLVPEMDSDKSISVSQTGLLLVNYINTLIIAN